jgi:hypothetical protein
MTLLTIACARFGSAAIPTDAGIDQPTAGA